MEQCFRVALWMCLLVGYLQAKPVGMSKPKPFTFDEGDLCFDLIRDASCVNNATFSSPTQVEDKCLIGAVDLFKKELIRAISNCDHKEYIKMTLRALDMTEKQETSCNFTMKVHEQFSAFVNATEAFVHHFNAYQLLEGQ